MPRIMIFILLISLLLCACQVPAAASPSTAPTVPETTAANTPEPPASPPEADFSYILPENLPAPSEVLFEPTPDFQIECLLSAMTIEEKVGQLFLARCPDENALEDIQAYHLGGYVLFGRDFAGQTPSTMAATLAAYQDAASIPMLIAVDEEGGTVTRVSSYRAFRESRFPSPRTLYAQGGLDLLLKTEAEKCALLGSLGINVNLAPVCDITTDSRAFLYSRSLGLSPEQTGTVIASMVKCMRSNRIGSVLKHFPGYGNNSDTHIGIAVDNRPLDALEHADLLPFAAGIDAGCGAIMVSHTFINALDAALPASLSVPVHRYLRNTMGFDGVIVTDDLAMGAITDLYGAEEAAILAVLAGNDLLCCSEYQIQYTAVLEAVRSGRIAEETLDQAVRRILRWKSNLGLLAF